MLIFQWNPSVYSPTKDGMHTVQSPISTPTLSPIKSPTANAVVVDLFQSQRNRQRQQPTTNSIISGA